MSKTITELCPEHSKKIMLKSTNKLRRTAIRCPDCRNNFFHKIEKLCEKHQESYDKWQKKQLDDIVCEDCR